jgi:hypothetical protein
VYRRTRGPTRRLRCVPPRALHVENPACLILEGKVWTFIRKRMRGLLVTDEAGVERVYIICEPATYHTERR